MNDHRWGASSIHVFFLALLNVIFEFSFCVAYGVSTYTFHDNDLISIKIDNDLIVRMSRAAANKNEDI